jgi:hypothetical protein
MKKSLLISISNFGDKQLDYLNTAINEYRSYQKYDVTINVHSTVQIPRDDINVILHDPQKTERLAYLHRQEFIDKSNYYDLFMYAENDVLIKEDAIDTYLKYDELLPPNHCLGFISYEKYPPDENLYLFNLWPKVFHAPSKLNTEDKMTGTSYITSKEICVDGNWYFILTSVCQNCYLLTKDKLHTVMKVPGYARTDWPNMETSHCGIFTNWCHSDGILYKVHTRNLEDLKKCTIQHLPGNTITKYGCDISGIATWNSLISDLNLS